MLGFALDGAYKLDIVVDIHTGTSRDELTDADVLLQTLEVVTLAADRSIGECLGGLLEGGSRDEGIRAGRSFGDTLQDGGGLNELDVRSARINELLQLLVELVNTLALYQRALEQILLVLDLVGAACVLDAYLAEHLTDDDLDVLVIDVNTLQTVNLLYLGDDVILHRRGIEYLKNTCRINITLGQTVALFNLGAVVNGLAVFVVVRNADLVSLAGLRIADDEGAEVLLLTQLQNTASARNDGSVLRLSWLRRFHRW